MPSGLRKLLAIAQRGGLGCFSDYARTGCIFLSGEGGTVLLYLCGTVNPS